MRQIYALALFLNMGLLLVAQEQQATKADTATPAVDANATLAQDTRKALTEAANSPDLERQKQQFEAAVKDAESDPGLRAEKQRISEDLKRFETNSRGQKRKMDSDLHDATESAQVAEQRRKMQADTAKSRNPSTVPATAGK